MKCIKVVPEYPWILLKVLLETPMAVLYWSTSSSKYMVDPAMLRSMKVLDSIKMVALLSYFKLIMCAYWKY